MTIESKRVTTVYTTPGQLRLYAMVLARKWRAVSLGGEVPSVRLYGKDTDVVFTIDQDTIRHDKPSDTAKFLKSLLNPEELGLAVTEEVRNIARKLLTSHEV